MPRVATDAVARILERMELQALRRNTHALAPREEPRPVHGDEVRHRAPEPHVPMQPEAAVHGVDHPDAPIGKLTPFEAQGVGVPRQRDAWRVRRASSAHWQVTRPSALAGGTAATLPEKYAQVSGNDCGWVALADHPPRVAFTMVRTTPADAVNLRFIVSEA